MLHSAQLGAVARSLAPLPLLVRATLRFSSGSPTRSALRLKNGVCILFAEFENVHALPLVAPLRVSLYCIFFLSLTIRRLRLAVARCWGGRAPVK